MVDDVQRIAGLRHVHARQRAPGAADGVEGAAAAAPRASRAAPACSSNARPRACHGRRRRASTRRSGPSGSVHRAADRAAVELDQLEAAAAEIAQRCRRRRGCPQHAQRREPRLLVAGQDCTGMAAERARPRRRTRRRCRRRAPRRSPAPRAVATPIASARRVKRSRSVSACSTPSGSAGRSVRRPRPRPQTTFSLKIGSGLRDRPSKTTRRTEFEPMSIDADAAGVARRWIGARRGVRSAMRHAVLVVAAPARRLALGVLQRAAAAGEARIGHEVVVRRDRRPCPGCSAPVAAVGVAASSSAPSSFRLATMIWSSTCCVHRRVLDRHQRLDPPVEVARHPVGRGDEHLGLGARAGRGRCRSTTMRACSRKRPTIDLTRMFSDRPGTPGRRQQMPRTTQVDLHAGLAGRVERVDQRRDRPASSS